MQTPRSTTVELGDEPFTQWNEPAVESFIRADVQKATGLLLKELPQISSLILAGGFGRGEGTVLWDGTHIELVNDYDFVVVSEEGITHEELREPRKRIAAELEIHHVDILPLTRGELSELVPYQFNYDLKYGSRLLWGEDALAQLPDFVADQIPLASCNLVLTNRVICLLECYSDDFKRRALTPDESAYLKNQTAKALLACAEGLLIRAGKYHHSYGERNQIFKTQFPEFGDLAELIDWATTLKLKPNQAEDRDPIRLWEDTVHCYFDVLGTFPALFEASAESPGTELPRSGAKAFLLEHLLTRDSSLHPIERVEMRLLAWRVAGFWKKRKLLQKARDEVQHLCGAGSRTSSWEEIRQTVVKLWHENLG